MCPHAICVLILHVLCPHTIYVFSYYMCCVLILYVFSYYMCPHTTGVLTLYMCPHTKCVHILYMCPHTIGVLLLCVLILCVRIPHTTRCVLILLNAPVLNATAQRYSLNTVSAVIDCKIQSKDTTALIHCTSALILHTTKCDCTNATVPLR